MKAHIKDDAQVSVNKGNLTTGEKKKAFTRSDVIRLITENTPLKDYKEWVCIDFFSTVLFLTIIDCANENDVLHVRIFQKEDKLFGTSTYWVADVINRDNVQMLVNTVKDLEAVTTLLQYEGIRIDEILVEDNVN